MNKKSIPAILGLILLVGVMMFLGNWWLSSYNATPAAAQSQSGQSQDQSSKELKIKAVKLAMAESKKKADELIGQGDWRKANAHIHDVENYEKQLQRLGKKP